MSGAVVTTVASAPDHLHISRISEATSCYFSARGSHSQWDLDGDQAGGYMSPPNTPTTARALSVSPSLKSLSVSALPKKVKFRFLMILLTQLPTHGKGPVRVSPPEQASIVPQDPEAAQELLQYVATSRKSDIAFSQLVEQLVVMCLQDPKEMKHTNKMHQQLLKYCVQQDQSFDEIEDDLKRRVLIEVASGSASSKLASGAASSKLASARLAVFLSIASEVTKSMSDNTNDDGRMCGLHQCFSFQLKAASGSASSKRACARLAVFLSIASEVTKSMSDNTNDDGRMCGLYQCFSFQLKAASGSASSKRACARLAVFLGIAS
eukprot:gene26317-17411_t